MRSNAARREFAVVLALAITGLALAFVVAFTPWYPTPDSAATSVPAGVLVR